MASSAGYSTAKTGVDDEEVEPAAQLRQRVESGMLRTVARLAERPPTPRSVMLLYLLVDILQLLIIPLSPSAGMPWGASPIMGSIYKFLLYINLLPRNAAASIPGLPYPYPALNLTVASIVVCGLLAAAFVYMWLSDAFSPPSSPQSAWKARAVWYLAPACQHALLVPMVAGLLAPLSCTSDSSTSWMGSGLVCWSGGHVGLVIAGATVCLAFLAVMLILAVTIVDRRVEVAGKENPACAMHGRVDACMILIRSAFAAFFVFGFSATPWATVIVGIVAGLAYIVAYGMWFPYYRLHVNQSFAIGGSVLLSAGIAAALAVGTMNGDESNGGAILFLFLIVPCAFCAYSSMLLRWKSFASMTDLSTPYLVELKARTLITDVVEPAMRFQAIGRASYGGRSTGSRASGGSRSGSTFGDDASVASGKGKPTGSHGARFSLGRHAGHRGVGAAHDRDGGDDTSVRSSASEKPGVAAGSGPRARSARSGHSGYSTDAAHRDGGHGGNDAFEAAAAGANGVATVGDALRLIDALYRDATRSMNGSAMLDIFAASYLGGVRNNRHLERLHLKSAVFKAGTWALDVRAFAFMREEAIIAREVDDSASRMTVQKRIELEELTQLSHQQVNATRALVLSFWEALSVRMPDLSKLQKTGAAINKALAETDASFKRLMVLAPQSPSLLRAYAEYLLELANNSRRGMELINDAEQIEDEQSRALTAAANDDVDFLMGAPTDFDLSADSVAMIRVSAEPDSLGEVLGINAPAQKLLGFSARELTGRNVDIVLPSPIAELHDGFLQKYIADGRERFVGASRCMFMQHRSGHLVPVKGSIAKSLTGDEWFTCAEEMTTNWMFLIVLGEESAWRLTGACKSAMAMMGIEGPAIKSGSVSLQNYVGDIEDLMAQFEVNADKSVLVRLLVADTSAGEVSASSSGAAGAGASSSGKSHGHHKSSGRTYAGKGPNGRHGGSKASSSTPSGVLVAARAQSFSMTGMDAPFVILRFRRATDADRSLMPLDAGAPGQRSGVAGEAYAVTGASATGRYRDDHQATNGAAAAAAASVVAALRSPSNKHVSFGEKQSGWGGGGIAPGAVCAANDADGAFDSDAHSDAGTDDHDEEALIPPRPPTPPSGRGSGGHCHRTGSSRSGSPGLAARLKPSGRCSGSQGSMPTGHSTGGDISLCPVMGGAGMRSGRTSEVSARGSARLPASALGSRMRGFDAPAVADAVSAHTVDATGSGCHAAESAAIDLGTDIFGPVCVSLPGAPASSAESARESTRMATGLCRDTTLTDDAVGMDAATLTGGSMSDPRALLTSSSSAAAAVNDLAQTGGRNREDARGCSGSSVQDLRSGQRLRLNKVGDVGSNSGAAVVPATATDAFAGLSADGEELMVTEEDVAASHEGKSDARVAAARSDFLAKAGAVETSDGVRLSRIEKIGSPATAKALDGASEPAALRSALSPKAPAASSSSALSQPLLIEPTTKAGSVHSGSKGSGGSGMSVSDIIRRGVHAKSKSLEGSLVVLRRSIILAFLLIAAASIASVAVTAVLFTQMMDNMRIVQMTGERALAMQRVYGDIFALQLHSSNKSVLPDGGVAKIASLKTNIDTFERYHIALFKLVDGQVQAEVDLYTSPTTIKVSELTPGTFISYDNLTVTSRTLSLMNAAAELIARARRVASLPPSSIWEGDPDAYFVVMNGRRPIRVAVNDSQLLADSRSAEQADTITLANDVVLGVGLGILLLVAAAVITPAVLRVLQAKARIFDIFLAVPLTVTKALRARTAKRVQAAAQEDNGMDVAMDIEIDDKDRGDAGEEDEGLAAVAMAANGGAVRLRNDSVSVDGLSVDQGLAHHHRDGDGDDQSRLSGPRRRGMQSGPGVASDAIDDVTMTAAGAALRQLGGRADSSTGAASASGKPQPVASTGIASVASKNKRRYSKAASATCGLLMRMLWPITAYMAFFIGMYIWRDQTVDMARHARSEVLWAHQLEFYIRQVNFNTRSSISYTARAFSLDQASRSTSNLDQAVAFSNSMLYGDPALNVRPTLQLYEPALKLWSSYSCLNNDGFYYTIPECEAFNNGILAKTGLLGALQDYFVAIRFLLKYTLANPGKPLNLNLGPPLLMQQYGTTFLPPAFSQYSSMVTETPMRQLSQYNTLNLLVTVASIMTLLGFYAFVYSPLIRQLDRDIKNVRGLLLIFPDEVSRNTAAIITAGREMLTDSQSVSGTSVVSASGNSRAIARRR